MVPVAGLVLLCDSAVYCPMRPMDPRLYHLGLVGCCLKDFMANSLNQPSSPQPSNP